MNFFLIHQVRATKGPGIEGDIALDNLQISEGSCENFYENPRKNPTEPSAQDSDTSLGQGKPSPTSKGGRRSVVDPGSPSEGSVDTLRASPGQDSKIGGVATSAAEEGEDAQERLSLEDFAWKVFMKPSLAGDLARALTAGPALIPLPALDRGTEVSQLPSRRKNGGTDRFLLWGKRWVAISFKK